MPQRTTVAATILGCVALGAGCRTTAPEPRPGQSARRFEGTLARRVAYRYLLYVPKAYAVDVSRRWPLVLFLHGSGERGDDLEALERHGPPKLLDSRDDFPAVVVSPQCPEGEFWDPRALVALLDDVTRRLRVDPDRVAVTGLSMGGRGTWDLVMTAPDRFAAIAPICGGAIPDRACRLRGVPVRAYHGAKDAVVPLLESRTVVDAVKACGGDAELFVDPDATHDAWSATYADPAFWEWLLSRRRGP